MITRQTKLQLLVFGLISVLGLTFTGAKYADLDKYFVDEGYIVAADFIDSGGIFEGAEVTYRGVRVGEVDELRLLESGVQARLKLEQDVEIPVDSRAVVQNRSAVGEQYIDLQPTRDGAPYMDKGDVIPQRMTSIPVPPTQLLVNLDRFITSVDTEDLSVVLDELGTAFEGSGEDLTRIVDAGDLLTRAATDALPQTLRLIEDGETVLDTQRDVSEQFLSFNRDLASLTQQIRDSDPDFRSLFANGTQSALETTDLIEANRSDLPILLSNLVTVAQVQKIRIPAIRQILVTYPNVAAGGFTVTPDNPQDPDPERATTAGTARFGLVTSMEPGVCGASTIPGGGEAPRGASDASESGDQGYGVNREPSDQRSVGEVAADDPGLAAELNRRNTTSYCGAQAAGDPEFVSQDGSLVPQTRGSLNAPRPDGLRPYTGQQDVSPTPPGGSAPAGGQASATAAPAAFSLGDYDPRTGNAITADGRTVTIGASDQLAGAMGQKSLQWLLLGPLVQR